MECRVCGAMINSQEKFCGNCGSKVVNDENLNIQSVTGVNQVNDNDLNIQNENHEKIVSNVVNNRKNNKGNKKILIILILLVVIGVLIYFFVIKDNDKLENNDLNNVTDNEINYKDDENDKSDKDDENDKNDKSQNNDDLEVQGDFKLVDSLANKYPIITTTEVSFNPYEQDDNTYTIKIESNGDLMLYDEACNGCDGIKLDIGGEKAKYMGSVSGSKGITPIIIVLTENKNIYWHRRANVASPLDVKFEKYETSYKFDNVCVGISNYEILYYDFFTDGLNLSSTVSFIGITNEGKYIELDYGFEIKPSIPVLYLRSNWYNYEADHPWTRVSDSIFVYEDGSIDYFNGLDETISYNQCKITKNYSACNDSLLTSLNYVVDSNNEVIKARIVFFDNSNNLYILSLDNKIYKLSKSRVGKNYIADRYNDLDVKNVLDYKTEGDYLFSLSVEYSNGKTEKFSDIYSGYVIFEKK